MREFIITMVFVIALGACFLFAVDMANSKETTTLDDALERPVEVKKFVDKDTGVVCYYVGRYPDYVNCVKVEDDSRD